MRLAALICAYHDDEEGGLRATLPLAGRSLVERQVRLAVAAGASPVVVLVERVPPDLAATVNQLRGEGLGVVMARSAEEASAAIDPSDRVLLVADGLIAEEGSLRKAAVAERATVLTVPDKGADERHERIDAGSRWAGLAIVDGALLRTTATELYDWDLQSTLLRRAIQGGAKLVPLGDAALTIATGADDLADAERRMMAAANRPGADWASRYALAPIEATATHLLAPTTVSTDVIRLGGVALVCLAALLFALDWRWAGGVLMLLAAPLSGIARRLSALRLQVGGWQGWLGRAPSAAAGVALLALGQSVAKESGWGCILLAVVTIAFLFALRGEGGTRAVPARQWLAERKGLTLAMIPFAILGRWDYGLGALALYAAGSFFWAQRHVHTDRSGLASG